MPPTLRVVLDQASTPSDPQLARVEFELARALVATAPQGCVVAAIVPSGADDIPVPGLVDVHRASFGRRELAAAWQFGIAPALGGGMIHAPSLTAPLVRHDRVHDNDQTVVTIWDLDAWEVPARLPKPAVLWHKAMLKRAEKHADAIVVPTHALAAKLTGIANVGHRLRVIEGAAPEGFAVPTDTAGRLRTHGLPEGALVVFGAEGVAEALTAITRAGIDAPVVLLDGPAEPGEAIAASGLAPARVTAAGALDDGDRAALLGSALAVVAPATTSAFPWRVIEALAVGAPVVAAASPVHREVLGDGGVLVDLPALADGLRAVLEARERYRVLSADQGRGFSWTIAAGRVWQLHADL